jgi:hypothetical protein
MGSSVGLWVRRDYPLGAAPEQNSGGGEVARALSRSWRASRAEFFSAIVPQRVFQENRERILERSCGDERDRTVGLLSAIFDTSK